MNSNSTLGNIAAYHALDRLRFVDNTDRVLATHGDDVDTLFADPAELEEKGADLEVLYAAVLGGMGVEGLSLALDSGVDVSVLSQALSLGLEPGAVPELVFNYGGEDLNGHLSNFVEAKVEALSEPDPVSRVLALYGE